MEKDLKIREENRKIMKQQKEFRESKRKYPYGEVYDEDLPGLKTDTFGFLKYVSTPKRIKYLRKSLEQSRSKSKNKPKDDNMNKTWGPKVTINIPSKSQVVNEQFSATQPLKNGAQDQTNISQRNNKTISLQNSFQKVEESKLE